MNTMCVDPAASAGRIVRGLGFGLCVLAATGCHFFRDAPPADTAAGNDGARCMEASESSEPQRGAVFIDVTYAPDGTPQVTPQRCKIADATQVTWRGPAEEPVVFEIRFKAAAPVIRGEGELKAERSPDGRYRVRRTLAGAGDYAYAVFANGKELDPAIIIR